MLILRAAIALIFACSLAAEGSAIAAEQFAGEVLKVDTAANKLTVKKPDGNRFTFAVDAKTAFTGSRKSLNDLAKGDQVTVEFQTGGGQYTALRVSTP
jgi:Cu/Ag efflux protein CusF